MSIATPKPARPRPSGIPTPGLPSRTPSTSGVVPPPPVTALPTPGARRKSSSLAPGGGLVAGRLSMGPPVTPTGNRKPPMSGSGAYTPSASSSTTKPGLTPRRSLSRPSSRLSSASSYGSAAVPPPPLPELSASTLHRHSLNTTTGGGIRAFSFEVGDKVRIESLGMEGTLRYVGETQFKSGIWAGVELEAGFAGRGKNDGSVAGTKLSSATAHPRPTSVLSTSSSLRSGRMTPSSFQVSGRATPSSMRPTTPSFSGRATPSFLNRSTTPSLSASVSGRASPNIGLPTPTAASRHQSVGFPTPTGSSRRQSILNQSTATIHAAAANAESDRAAAAALAASLADKERLLSLETQLSESSQTIRMLRASVEALERASTNSKDAQSKEKLDAQSQIQNLTSKLEVAEANQKDMRESLTAKLEGKSKENFDAVAKQKEIDQLQNKVAQLDLELQAEKLELGVQVTELRRAGQDTIMLYEERLNTSEARRFETENLVRALEEELERAKQNFTATSHSANDAASSAPMSRQASTATEIDNENLVEQIRHLSNKIQLLEEQLEDAQVQAEKDESQAQRKIGKYKELEITLRNESNNLREQVQMFFKSEQALKSKVDETEFALKQNQKALENARAEVEGLRAEIINLESLQANGKAPDTPTDTLSPLSRRESSDNRPGSSASRRSRSSRGGKDDDHIMRDQVVGFQHIIRELEKDNVLLTSELDALKSENALLLSETESLRDSVKDLENAMDELIEREEASLDAASAALDAPSTGPLPAKSPSVDQVSLQKQLTEAQAKLRTQSKKHEDEIEELMVKIGDLDKQNQSEIHELESLVESKIYKEDELEREVENLKYQLKKLSKSQAQTPTSALPPKIPLPAEPSDSIIDITPKTNGSHTTTAVNSPMEPCGICDGDHSIDQCPVFSGGTSHLLQEEDDSKQTSGSPLAYKDLSTSRNGKHSSVPQSSKEFCEDCETFGHLTEECPYAMEVF